MSVKYGKFELPEKIKLHEKNASKTFGRFIAEPFERGFAHTIGNSLRRVMLTSIEAPAIISVRLEGVAHEYMAIEGIVEDMVNIILNLKGAYIRKFLGDDEHAHQIRILTSTIDITQEQLDSNGGQVQVTLGDIITDQSYDIVNPELHIMTVTQPMKRQIDLRIGFGRGYVPSERHVVPDKRQDDILLDAAFSPVILVNYFVENTRVGQDTDLDKLIMEVTTDGRVTPAEAISFAAQIAQKHFNVFEYLEEKSINFDEGGEEGFNEHDEIIAMLCLRIDEIELSVRSTNCLSGANIETIAELVAIPERKMLDFRNFGKKSLNEIKAKLTDMGLGLGMDLTKYGIRHDDNIKEKVKELSERIAEAKSLTQEV